jgi:hypothetical protein
MRERTLPAERIRTILALLPEKTPEGVKMKLNSPIEINGLTNVVIDRRFNWRRTPMGDPEKADQPDMAKWSLYEFSFQPGEVLMPTVQALQLDGKTDAEMARYLNDLLAQKGRRAWLKIADTTTLNIGMKKAKVKKPKSLAESLDALIEKLKGLVGTRIYILRS